MYTIGFVNTDNDRVLINPAPCANSAELHTWLIDFFNKNDYSLDTPITQESIDTALTYNMPIRINITGFNVAVMFVSDTIISEPTDSFKYIDM